MSSVIVIGKSGLIGHKLTSLFAEKGCLSAYTMRVPNGHGNDNCVSLDLADIKQAGDVPAELKFERGQTIYISAAMTKFAECAENPALSDQVNVVAPALIAEQALEAGARVVFLSSIAVFSGDNEQVSVEVKPDGTSLYGLQKAEAERRLIELGGDVAIVRLTKVLQPDAPLLVGWKDALTRKEIVKPFSDMQMAPITLSLVVDFLESFVDKFEPGVFQLSAAKDMPYDEIAKFIARACGSDEALVEPTLGKDMGIAPAQLGRFASMGVGQREMSRGFIAPDPRDVVSWSLGLAQ